jgi:hypothetical protein
MTLPLPLELRYLSTPRFCDGINLPGEWRMTEETQLARLCKLLRTGSYVLFFLSLVSTAFIAQYGGLGQVSYRGFAVLLTGPLGLVLDFHTNWPWLGNLALFAAWLALGLRANIIGGTLGTIALIAGARFFSVSMVTFDYESGMPDKIASFGPGFWLWIASILCALAAAIFQMREKRSWWDTE